MINLVPYVNQIEKSATCINSLEVESLGLVQSNVDIDIAIFFDTEQFINKIHDNVKVIITTAELEKKYNFSDKIGVVISNNPRLLFFNLHNLLSANENKYNRITYNTIIGTNCSISDMCFIEKENVTIGNNVVIEPFVTIYKNSVIKDGSIIRSGARIGGEGFEFKQTDDNCLSVKHSGGVIIGENVEIQNNTCVDKAVYPWDDTEIGNFTKIDNFVHLGHGVKVADHGMIAAGSIIAGRTEIGKNVWIGIGCTIKNAIKIGNNCRVNMGSVLISNLKDGKAVSGNYAIDHEKFLIHQKNILLNGT